MNRIITFLLIYSGLFGLQALMPEYAQAQISEGGYPASFEYQNTFKSDVVAVDIPVNFSIEDLKTVDAWQVSQGAPLKVATFIDANLTINDTENQRTLPNGTHIWQLRIRAKGAIALMVSYKDFYIPEGGKLFIYNADKTQVIGAFTNATNPVSKEYATEFIAGDDIILEYEAASSGEKPRIHIDKIGYGYNHLSISDLKSATKAQSGSCMVNINCEEGDAWQSEKDGICEMILIENNYAYLCSGALINNTAQDFKPYILSAYHCINTIKDNITQSDLNRYLFYFHYEHLGCDNTSPVYRYKTITGCTEVASTPLDKGSDGLLLLLNQNIPSDYNVYYNGWDRSNSAPQSGTGIHHPGGDYMKISTYESPAQSTTWYGNNNTVGAKQAHWEVAFNETANGHSVTEQGSSGSPLFNQAKLIVGTLSGGNSTCDDPELTNLYGKLYYHWDKHSTDKTGRMDIYLDPLKTGVTQLAGRYATEPKPAPAKLSLTYKNKEVVLQWEAPVSSVAPSAYYIYKDNKRLGSTQNISYTDISPSTGAHHYDVAALYPDDIESAMTGGDIYIFDYQSPSGVKAIVNGNDVKIKWEKPVYNQLLFWGSGETKGLISLGTDPIYYGQQWERYDLTPLNKKQLKAVYFIPIEGATYSILIVQGNRRYEQVVVNPVYNEINTIVLHTPFIIDASESMQVAIHVSNHTSNTFPIACDSGPSINGKGNLFSYNGIDWEYLYNSTEEQAFDSNFILAIAVSSEEGELVSPATLSYSTLRSQQSSVFPEVTGYTVYRNNIRLKQINDKLIVEYNDTQVPSAQYVYEVSALYGNEESNKSKASEEIIVDTEVINLSEATITPTSFSNQIQLIGNEKVSLLEVISADGKLVIKKEHPDAIIYTGNLSSGIYLFRLHTDNGIRVVKGIKRQK